MLATCCVVWFSDGILVEFFKVLFFLFPHKLHPQETDHFGQRSTEELEAYLESYNLELDLLLNNGSYGYIEKAAVLFN